MKKLLLVMGFCCSMSLANAQQTQRIFQDNQHNTIGYLQNGSYFDKSNTVVGQFKNENGAYTIYDNHNKAKGYILNAKEVQDANHKTIGYLNLDRTTHTTTVEDASHKTLGYVKPGGIVENDSHTVIGYSQKVEPVLSSAYFFLVKF